MWLEEMASHYLSDQLGADIKPRTQKNDSPVC